MAPHPEIHRFVEKNCAIARRIPPALNPHANHRSCWLAALTCRAVVCSLPALSAANASEGIFRLTISDATGKLTPAMVSLRNVVTKQNHDFGEDRLRILEVEEYGRAAGARKPSSKRPECRSAGH